MVGRRIRGGFVGTGMAVMLALSACGTAPIDEAVPASSASASTGEFPNLNVPMTPATAQITPEERAATSASLRGRRDSLGAGVSAPPPSDAARMREIGSRHADETLREIEGD